MLLSQMAQELYERKMYFLLLHPASIVESPQEKEVIKYYESQCHAKDLVILPHKENN